MLQVKSVSPEQQRLLWLGAALFFTVLPLPGQHPLWVFLAVVSALIWRVLAGFRAWRLPSNAVLLVLVAAALAAMVLTHTELRSLEPAISLLALLLAFKFLELRQSRDYPMLVMIGLFFLFAWTLREIGLAQGLHLVAAALFLFLALLQTMREAGPWALSELGREASGVLLMALPIMLLLFLLFPRIPGPLWSVTYESDRRVTGFSDEMRPGDMASLAGSMDVAFRVNFADTPPEDALLYWRGIVLDTFDGEVWRRAPHPPAGASSPASRTGIAGPESPTSVGPRLRYEVFLEPHGYPWLFALDVPQRLLSIGPSWGQDHTVVADSRVTERMNYRMESVLTAQSMAPLSLTQRAAALDLPAEGNPRSLALARVIRAGTGSDREYLAALLRRFNEDPYRYTLNVPALGANPVDRFLFETRAGFCEHYASALVYLLRAGNVPARVVLGYLGGELNPLTGLYVVRQYRAHAWAEVWLEGMGWLRVDPVAFIDPARIDPGIANLGVHQGSANASGLAPEARWRLRVAMAWDTANTLWFRHVVGYGHGNQSRLLEWFGSRGDHARNLFALLTLVLGALALVMLLLTWFTVRDTVDPLVRGWQRVLRQLARRGLQMEPGETVMSFAARMEGAHPHFGGRLFDVALNYQRLRYGPACAPADVRQFVLDARRFRAGRPKRNPRNQA